MLAVVQDNLLGGMLGHQRRYDARDKNHDDHAVQYLVVHQILAGADFQAHAYHDHGDGSGGMGTRQSEHHVAGSFGQTEQQARQVGGHGLAEGAEEGDEKHNPQHVGALEQGADIDEHAHADEEIGNEQGVADELDAVHQRRHMGYVAAENQPREEGSHDALDVDGLGEGCREEHHAEHEDVLHDGIGIAAQEIACQLGYAPHHQGYQGYELGEEQQPEGDAGA